MLTSTKTFVPENKGAHTIMNDELDDALVDIQLILETLRDRVEASMRFYHGSDENAIDFLLKFTNYAHSKQTYLKHIKTHKDYLPKHIKNFDGMMRPLSQYLQKLIRRCEFITSASNVTSAQKQKCLDSLAEDIRVRFKALTLEYVLCRSEGIYKPKNDKELEALYKLLNQHKSSTQNIIEFICFYPEQDDFNDGEKIEEINKTLETAALNKAHNALRERQAILLADLKKLTKAHPAVENELAAVLKDIDIHAQKIQIPERSGLVSYDIKIAFAECHLQLAEISKNVMLWVKEQKREVKAQLKLQEKLEAEEHKLDVMLAKAFATQKPPSAGEVAEDQEVDGYLKEIIKEQNVAAQVQKSAIKQQKREEFAKQQLTFSVASTAQTIDAPALAAAKAQPVTLDITLNADHYELLDYLYDDATPKNGVINFKRILLLAKNCGAKIEQNGTSHVVFRFDTPVGSDACTIPRHNHHGHGRNKVLGVYIAGLRDALNNVGITPYTVKTKSNPRAASLTLAGA